MMMLMLRLLLLLGSYFPFPFSILSCRGSTHCHLCLPAAPLLFFTLWTPLCHSIFDFFPSVVVKNKSKCVICLLFGGLDIVFPLHCQGLSSFLDHSSDYWVWPFLAYTPETHILSLVGILWPGYFAPVVRRFRQQLTTAQWNQHWVIITQLVLGGKKVRTVDTTLPFVLFQSVIVCFAFLMIVYIAHCCYCWEGRDITATRRIMKGPRQPSHWHNAPFMINSTSKKCVCVS